MKPLDLDKHCQDLAGKIVDSILADSTKAAEYKLSLVETLKDLYDIGAGDAIADPKTIQSVKSVLMSKTYWGLALGALGQIAPHFGFHLGSEQATQYASEIVSGIGTALAAYGRYKAFKQLA